MGRGHTRVYTPPTAINDRLADLGAVRDNPGNLIGRCYVPPGVKRGTPLVVVLHGCTQNAAVYDHGSGWSRLADRHGFALLFPEQQRANNAMLCFNWFTANDTQRGMGEAASIRSMIETMTRVHGVDPKRIFVTGLSAGGAMASVMLATYPEVFAGGAIIAGVAYGCAGDVTGAFDCMGGRARGDAAELALKVRRASPHKGPWPRVQVWQGSADHTVVPSNAEAIVRQWTELHKLAPMPDREERVGGYPRRTWLDEEGTPLIEQYEITGMAHGVPLAPGTAEGQSGEAGAHMVDVGLSSTDRIAAFFGIAPAVADRTAAEPRKQHLPRAVSSNLPLPALGVKRLTSRVLPGAGPASAEGVRAVIENALKSAGLMR
jgi:poly(hydroxyalkanoate) depolymerase family esterase